MSKTKLMEMLKYRLRPFSDESDEFTGKYFSQLDEETHQAFYTVIGKNPKVAFVCQYMSSVKDSGQNSILMSDDTLYIDEKDIRNSTNNFNYIVSAYILLEMIKRKVSGIYLFLSESTYQEDRYVNGTETIGFSSTSNIWGKLRKCDQTIFLGNYGDRDLLITDSGHRVCSNDYKEFICNYFGLRFAKENPYLHCTHSNSTVGNLAEFIPENIVLPVGVNLGKTEHNLDFYKYQKNLIVDLTYLENLIDKLVRFPANESPIKRYPEHIVNGEFIGFDLNEPTVLEKITSTEKNEQGFFYWLKSLF